MLRIIRLALHLARGLLTAAIVFPLQTRERRKQTIQGWSARLLRVLAVRLHVHGTPHPARPLMLVANHVSWLDIFAINAVIPARFVAKSEIRGWPVLGWLCERSGTLFIDRARRRDTARINTDVSSGLLGGDVFAVFPEGTTTDGSTLLGFHGSLLAAALPASACVQPVALGYRRADATRCVEAAFDGDKSFWDSVREITNQRTIEAHIWFIPPVSAGVQHRRELAREARHAIASILFPEAPDNRTARAGDHRVSAH